jgi:CubicO group peptidase (beta-lactamase class C family)
MLYGITIQSLLFIVTSLLLSCIQTSTKSKTILADQKIINSEVVNDKIETYLQRLMIQERFTGSALIMIEDSIIHAKGYGNAKEGLRNNVTTPFHVASITKQFTATAVLQLVENGKIELDSTINKYLPSNYNSSRWNNVTVHHLLSHSSGIQDYAVTRDYYDVVDGFCLGNTVDGMVKEAMGKDLEFNPGSQYNYSNIGFTLLGFIIEQVSDTSYEKYMKDHIFSPLNMKHTRIHVIGHEPTTNEAEGFRWDNEKDSQVPDDIVSLPVTAPDGGLVTTLSDFYRWSQIYRERNQDILTSESLQKLTAAHVPMRRNGPDGKPESYGYGLVISENLLSHSGYIVGFRSHFILDRKNKLLIVVFSNNITNNPKKITTGLYQYLMDLPVNLDIQ